MPAGTLTLPIETESHDSVLSRPVEALLQVHRALGIVGLQSLFLLRRHVPTLPCIGAKPKPARIGGPIQLEQELDIRILHDLALLVVALALPPLSLAFLEHEDDGQNVSPMRKDGGWGVFFGVIIDLGAVARQLAAAAHVHLLVLLAAAVARRLLFVEPVVSIGILIELDEFIKLAREDLVHM